MPNLDLTDAIEAAAVAIYTTQSRQEYPEDKLTDAEYAKLWDAEFPHDQLPYREQGRAALKAALRLAADEAGE